MSRQQVLQVIIAVILVISFLVGCGGSAPTAVSEAPAATSEPEQAAATPIPPTETPMPTIVEPQPGAVLIGDVEDSENASGTVVYLKLSEDGTSIVTAGFGFVGPGKCNGISLGEGSLFNAKSVDGPFPITEGGFDISLPEGGELKGQFTSPTEASGTIKAVGVYLSASCEFGPSKWSAKVGETLFIK